ncbi:MAG TPA: type II toxin-antitoxin system RelE/ParE family toxin [Fimbriiglobus sp.]|jgi:hypothetical protein
MAEFRLLSGAKADLRRSEAWYRAQDTDMALGFRADAHRTIDEIARNPDAWPRIDNRHRFKPLRDYPFYVVYRRYFEDVVIVAVSHNDRSHRFWKNR